MANRIKTNYLNQYGWHTKIEIRRSMGDLIITQWHQDTPKDKKRNVCLYPDEFKELLKLIRIYGGNDLSTLTPAKQEAITEFIKRFKDNDVYTGRVIKHEAIYGYLKHLHLNGER